MENIFDDIRESLQEISFEKSIGKTVLDVYETPSRVIMIFEDNTVLHYQSTTDFHDIPHLRYYNIDDLEDYHLYQLNLITEEEYIHSIQIQEEQRKKEQEEHDYNKYLELKERFEGENNGSE